MDGAAATAAPDKPSSGSMSILVFEIISPINRARVLRLPSPHSAGRPACFGQKLPLKDDF